MIVTVQYMTKTHWITKAVLKATRLHDLNELKIIHPELNMRQAVEASLQISLESWGFIGSVGEPLGVGGVSENGSIWFIGSVHLNVLKNKLGMLKVGRKLVREAASNYGEVWNLCSDDPGQLWAMEQLGFIIHKTPRENVRYIQCVS